MKVDCGKELILNSLNLLNNEALNLLNSRLLNF